jgi:hypothetical protein
MHDLTDLNIDARRAEMDYRTAKLAGAGRVRLAHRRWWQRSATTTASSTTN